MRLWEIIEAARPDQDAERERQARVKAWRQLDTARRKRTRAAQEYADRLRTADDEQRAAQQKLAECGKNVAKKDFDGRR
jgi:hypothetical protein